VNVALLRESYYGLKRKAAPGVDGRTWKEYETGLEDRLPDLHGRVHRGAYRAQPSRRVYLPKANGKPRPLGIAALEDKIVQSAVVRVLQQIYEEEFRGFSYGFRPGRSQHGALDALYVGIRGKKVSWILDMDLKGFFDNIDQEHLLEMVERRIADPRILRLIRKWLNAGVIENGEWPEPEKGTPQGAVVTAIPAATGGRCRRTACGSGYAGLGVVTTFPDSREFPRAFAFVFPITLKNSLHPATGDWARARRETVPAR
jgi:group II intron reverse transcriptase/maturase